jgi:hypothetical protein
VSSNAIAHREEQRALDVDRPQSANFLAMILDAAKDPEVDAAKVEAMANLAIKLQDRELEHAFNRDLAAAITEMPRITKTGRIVIPAKDGKPERLQGTYAKFEDLDAVVRPILARHNLAIRFELGSENQGITTARPILIHRNGHVDRGDALRVPADQSGSKNNAQAIGSASSYGKRYAMCAALNIVTEGEDTDGRYILPTDPLSPPEERKIAEAEQAATDGRYGEWYRKQKPDIREMLILRGIHGRLGAPDRSGSAGKEIEPEAVGNQTDSTDSGGPPPSEDPGAGRARRRTPDELVTAYCDRIKAAATRAALEAITTDAKTGKFMADLKAKHPDLWKRAYDCECAAFEAFDRGGGAGQPTLV